MVYLFHTLHLSACSRIFQLLRVYLCWGIVNMQKSRPKTEQDGIQVHNHQLGSLG